jgi:hypothetical protein
MLPASVRACSYGDRRFVSYRSVYTLSGSMPDDPSRMLALVYFFASFAQVSLNVTVRFHLCFSAVESGSSVK